MDASVLRLNDENDDLLVSIGLAVGLHVVLLLIMLVAGWWEPAVVSPSAAGPVVEATLMISSEDIAVAEASAEEAPKPAPEEMTPPPQPLPVPTPQDSPEPPQPTPQEQLLQPDPVNQEEVARLAAQAAEEDRLREQERQRTQEQIDLTARIQREEAERRQQAREQQRADIQRQREEAARITRMEEQRLEQLEAARTPSPPPSPRAAEAPPQPASGANGVDTGLEAKYAAAMHAVARRNWNRSLVPEATPCKVEFTQLPGGAVTTVSFLSCPFDAQGRESVERALRRDDMPYLGFETVFKRRVTLTFCYPEEAAQCRAAN